jgi:UDP-glucose 4-epimerase
VLLASKGNAETALGWRPRLSSLETLIETAWNWHRRASAAASTRG